MKTIDTPLAVIKTAYSLGFTKEAQAKLAEVEEAVAYLDEQTELARAVTITDDASNEQGAALAVNLAKAGKVLDTLQKYFTSPLEAAKKSVIARFKDLTLEGAKQEQRLRDEAVALWTKRENEKRQIEAKRIADEQAATAKARALGKKAPTPVAAAPVEEVARATKTENGSLGITLVWGFNQDTVDLSKVPEMYIVKTLNTKLVNAAIAGGTRQIPGLEIKEMPRTAVR